MLSLWTNARINDRYKKKDKKYTLHVFTILIWFIVHGFRCLCTCYIKEAGVFLLNPALIEYIKKLDSCNFPHIYFRL